MREILKGTLYLDSWEHLSAQQDQDVDLTSDQLEQLKQSQLQGILVHQMMINLVADKDLLSQQSVKDFFGNILCEDIAKSIKIAEQYCNNNIYDMYDCLYIPSYFVYIHIGKHIIDRLQVIIPDEKFVFAYPKEISEIDQPRYDWQRYMMIAAFLHAPDQRIGEYFGSWM
ncbi:MAG: hypothetical protein AAB492_01345 [Patescibacteria group bacterium]